LEEILNETFPYTVISSVGNVVFGRSYFIGKNKNNAIKLDIYYSNEPFVFPILVDGVVRLAPNEEIAAMKFEVITNDDGGRKKDFWDIHELLDVFTLEEMIGFYLQRNPYGSSRQEVLEACLNFSGAEDDLLPNCYRNKAWELIKIDIEEQVQNILNTDN
jgi:hypothetical protein